MKKHLWVIVLMALFIVIVGCDKDRDYDMCMEEWAIFVMDSDGDNNKKIKDISSLNYVEFIHQTDKLLYNSNDSLFTIHLDGTEQKCISENIFVPGTKLGYSKAEITEDGSSIFFTGVINDNDDLYRYDVDTGTITNLTQTDAVNERNLRLSRNSTCACFLAVTDTSHAVCSFDLVTSEIDTLYTSTKRIPGCVASPDGSKIYFAEEVYDPGRYYQTAIKELNRQTSAVNVIDSISTNTGAHEIVANDDFIIYKRLGSGEWVTFSLLDGSMTTFAKCMANSVNLNNDNEVLFVYQLAVWLYKIESGGYVKIRDGAESCAYNMEETKICYIGRYYRIRSEYITE